jgi:Tfp pilus assembly protein PilO
MEERLVKRQLLILTGICLFLLAAMLVLLLPKESQLADLKARLQQEQVLLRAAKNRASSPSPNDQELQAMMQKIPADPDESRFLHFLRDTIIDTNVTFDSLQFTADQENDSQGTARNSNGKPSGATAVSGNSVSGLMELHGTVAVHGSYEALRAFIQRLQDSPRLLSLTSWNIDQGAVQGESPSSGAQTQWMQQMLQQTRKASPPAASSVRATVSFVAYYSPLLSSQLPGLAPLQK